MPAQLMSKDGNEVFILWKSYREGIMEMKNEVIMRETGWKYCFGNVLK